MTAEDRSPAGLRGLLRAWGDTDGNPGARAAMHLLLFTEIPDAPAFARHVQVDDVRTVASGLVHCAWVRDWDALIGDPDLYLTDNEARFLKLAASFATGRPVDLCTDVTSSLGHQHARRLAEAVIIAADVADFVTVSGPPSAR